MYTDSTPRPRATWRFAAAAATCAVALGIAHNTTTAGATTTATDRLTPTQERVVRAATQQFRNVDAAKAAGYVLVSDCVSMPGMGGMGYHFLRPDLAGDPAIDPSHPESLVYTKSPSGRYVLAAVEYFRVDPDQNLETDRGRARLYGHPFDGPMLGHSPGMPIHFDLHVWLYQHNPAGQLAAWNPDVHC